VKNKQGKYGINICGGEKYCNGSAVCREGNGYGSLVSVIFDYNRHDIKLKYSNGSKCNNSKLNFHVSKSLRYDHVRKSRLCRPTDFYTSEIIFICNESIGIGTPRLLLVSENHLDSLGEILNALSAKNGSR